MPTFSSRRLLRNRNTVFQGYVSYYTILWYNVNIIVWICRTISFLGVGCAGRISCIREREHPGFVMLRFWSIITRHILSLEKVVTLSIYPNCLREESRGEKKSDHGYMVACCVVKMDCNSMHVSKKMRREGHPVVLQVERSGEVRLLYRRAWAYWFPNLSSRNTTQIVPPG